MEKASELKVEYVKPGEDNMTNGLLFTSKEANVIHFKSRRRKKKKIELILLPPKEDIDVTDEAIGYFYCAFNQILRNIERKNKV